MKIECEVSVGELVDKISILLIKEKMIKDNDKLVHVTNEKNVLENTLNHLNLKNIEHHLQEMIDINMELWKIEDDIRDKEKKKEFDQDFITLARSVYIKNDERFKRKNLINSSYDSKIVEVKSYQKY